MTLQGEVGTYLEHVERHEARRAVDAVLALFDAGVSCTDIVTQVLAPAQLEVGRRWEVGDWSVADEHFATAVVDDVLGALAAGLRRDGDRTMALCSAEGEWHVTPLRMGALVLREHGWRVRVLGASTPAAHLRPALERLAPDVVAVHCALPANLLGVPPVVAVAHDLGLPVLAAGRGFGPDDVRATRLGCDGWAPDARRGALLAGPWAEEPPPRAQPVPAQHADEVAAVAQRRADLLDEAHRRLAARLPGVVGADDRQQADVRADLAGLLDAAAATLLVDDERIFTAFAGWLEMVLVARGVPVVTLTAALDALAAAAQDLPGLRAVLGDRAGLA